MLIGKPLIINCPKCNKEFTQMNLASGNTFGGVFWSDGSFFAPMLPDLAVFTRCTECKTIFNAQTAPNHESENWEETDKLPNIEHLEAEELVFALENKIYKSIEEEIYLRKRLWWKLNHHPWKKEKPKSIESSVYKLNNEALIALLDPSDEDQLLMQAELHRNLGNFDTCLNLINQLTDSRDETRVTLLKKACTKKIRGTFQLEY
jgi:hypothetical protein